MKFKKILLLILIILNIGLCSQLKASSLNFEFYTYQGKKYNIADFRGKYVLLNLFASYCPTCMIELGIFNKLNNRCNVNGLKIISLMVDKEGIPLLPKIVSSRKINYTIGLAPAKIFTIFPDFSELPTTYFLNKKGEIIYKFTGYKSLNSWLEMLSKYVKCN